MGFGRPVSRAILGEPLRVSVPLRLEAGETIDAECVQVEVHFGESKLSSSQVQVSLVGGNGREATVQVRTTPPINEPIVTYELTAGCQAKISRQFVALADPPGMTRPVSPVAPPVVTPLIGSSPTSMPEGSARAAADPSSQEGATATSSRSSREPAKRTSRSSRTARSTQTPRSVAQAPVVRQVAPADAAASPRTSLSLTPKAAAAVVPAAERLVLDPVETDAAAHPDLRMSGSLGTLGAIDETGSPEVQARRAAAAALWQAMNLSPEDIARDRQKLLAQEQMLAQLQQQASQPRGTDPASPAQRADAGAQAEGSGLLYLVGALALLGLGLCVALFMKLRRRQQEEAAWWQSQMQEPQGEAADVVAPPAAPTATPTATPPAAPPVAPVAAVPVPPQQTQPESPKSDIERASTRVATPGPAAAVSSRQAKAAVTPAAAPVTPARQAAHEATREVSVEELIDLEQQADFFVVLGQDDAALDLLESHVHSVSASRDLPAPGQAGGLRARSSGLQPAFQRPRARLGCRPAAWA